MTYTDAIPTRSLWAERADHAQAALERAFWNSDLRVMNQRAPCGSGCNEPYVYWWHAHTLDVLTDALLRTGDPKYAWRLGEAFEGARALNGGTLRHNWYDDMQWMALALLRAEAATREGRYLEGALELWRDIQGGWNDHMGGGIAWKKDQLDYKNTPANAPATILAARLYARLGREEDLAWARRLYAWQLGHLVDPETGFVWDGLNRLGDGRLEDGWHFTYNQGAFLGAALALFHVTGEEHFRRDARRTSAAARARLVDAADLLPDEGDGDGALFGGIFVRYLTELLREAPHLDWADVLRRNAGVLWEHGRNPHSGVFGPDWRHPPGETASLSGMLSGVMLLEVVTRLEHTPFGGTA